MPTPFEALMPALEDTTRSVLGDTVLYRRAGQPAFVEIRAFFDPRDRYESGPLDVAQSAPTLDVSVSDVAEPDTRDRIVVSGRPDIYRPETWLPDDEGLRWIIVLEKAK